MNIDQRRCAAFVGQLTNQAHDLARGFRVEGRRRLIDQKQVGFLHQCPGDADPLALAARKGVGPVVLAACKADPVEQLEGVGDVFGRIIAPKRMPQADRAKPPGQHVFHNREAFDQVVFLENHADVAARLTQIAAVQRGQFQPAQFDGPGRRLDQTVDAAD